MKLIIGIVLGAFYLTLVGLAAGTSAGAWEAGNADLGFWWGVIGALLAIAGTGAVVGTWVHSRPSEE